MTPHPHINPLQWHQSIGYARQICARIFRDGGRPEDALSAFGLGDGAAPTDWSAAVDRIAQSLCAAPERKAA
ncbi:MAG: hypothetical protein AB7K67_16965 [Hyphomicrobiaceae bacterium]|jgi:hypothetical protein